MTFWGRKRVSVDRKKKGGGVRCLARPYYTVNKQIEIPYGATSLHGAHKKDEKTRSRMLLGAVVPHGRRCRVETLLGTVVPSGA